MKRMMIGLAFVTAVLAAGCQWLEKRKGEGKLPWTEGAKSIQSTVPWSGQAIAADTFVKISKAADLAVVNIAMTKIVKNRGPHKFLFGPGPNSRTPSDDFFGDDIFRHFFGAPRERDDRPERKLQSLGSGFILNGEGYIVTNNHVIDQADEITVTIGADREYKARVIGKDPKTDVALIKVDAKEKLTSLVLGDSDSLAVGEIVVAIGNPFGLSHTVTQGIVSAKERTIGFGPYDNFIQTDASINLGNSGGPLLNLRAEVVGINAAIVQNAQGIGFAIPINLAKNIVEQLKDTGKVTRGWLGVGIQKVDHDLAKSLGLEHARGALVSIVQPDSPAEKVGLQSGDVITKFGDVAIQDYNELPRLVASTSVGAKVRLEIVRNGKKVIVEPVIEVLKAGVGEEEGEPQREKKEETAEKDKLGLRVRTLAPEIAAELELPLGTKGVLVEGVEQDKPIAEKGVRRGDVIVEINRKKISDQDGYRKALKLLRKGDSVMLLIRRGAEGQTYIAMTL